MFTNKKPVFRYVGGKTWLKNPLNEELIRIIQNNNSNFYIELFAGGIGSFIANAEILYNNNIKNIVLNDINTSIISFYHYLNSHNNELMKTYLSIEDEFEKSIPLNYTKQTDKKTIKILLSSAYDIYLERRTEFNDCKKDFSIKNAALLLFLQNHCFNGIYRENKQGEYNTAFNWEARKSENVLRRAKEIRDLLSNFKVIFSNLSYEKLDIPKQSIIYADPPYLNEIKNTEINYNKNNFNIIDIEKLTLILKDSSFIFSHYLNEDVLNVFDIYIKKENYIKKVFDRKNIISGKSSTRSTIKKEMLLSSI